MQMLMLRTVVAMLAMLRKEAKSKWTEALPVAEALRQHLRLQAGWQHQRKLALCQSQQQPLHRQLREPS